jgi:hypothetical protein
VEQRASEDVGVTRQADSAYSLAPPFRSAWHNEIAVGHDTIVLSDSTRFAFYDRQGNPKDANLGTGAIVSGTNLFQPFWRVSSPQFLNRNLPLPPVQGPDSPPWQVCDATRAS